MNLLFIYTDEQRIDTLGCYGNPVIYTPNIDRFAEDSFVFYNCYVTQPVCTPSRSSILTGLYPHTTGCTQNNIPLPGNIKCFPEMLFGNYRTAHYGKWHLGDEVFPQHGFEEWLSIEDQYFKYFSETRDRKARSSYHHYLVELGYKPDKEENVFSREMTARLPEKYCKPAWLARKAVEFIKRNRNNNFILYINFLEPHMPFFGPRDSQYDRIKIILPINFYDIPTEKNHLKSRLLYEAYKYKGISGYPLITEYDWRDTIARYWGLCSLVDTYVGYILDALKEYDLWDKTIIVYTSDHGDMMGSHRMVAKCVMFEEALRVPLIIRVPGVKGRLIKNRISQINLVPTLLELLGEKIPDHLEGESLCKLMLEKEEFNKDIFVEWNGSNSGITADVIDRTGFEEKAPDYLTRIASREEIISAIKDPIRTIITPDGWKLNYSLTREEHEMFNLNEDPGERYNLYGEREFYSIFLELYGKLKSFFIKDFS